jgi:hypothetical protein
MTYTYHSSIKNIPFTILHTREPRILSKLPGDLPSVPVQPVTTNINNDNNNNNNNNNNINNNNTTIVSNIDPSPSTNAILIDDVLGIISLRKNSFFQIFKNFDFI